MKTLDKNIFFDGASKYAWEDLNESLFLTRFLDHLREELGSAFGEFQFYILSSHNIRVTPESAGIIGSHKILFFISDETCQPPPAWADQYLAVFKGYLTSEPTSGNVFPFNIGYVKDVPSLPIKPILSRGIDLFFSGNLNENRFALYHALSPFFRHLPEKVARRLFRDLPAKLRKSLFPSQLPVPALKSHLRFNTDFKDGLPPADYAALLQDSRIAFCPRGFHSAETFRHMEALRAGCVVISEPLPDTHFYRNAPIITAAHWKEGVEVAKKLACNPEQLEQFHLKSLKWWEEVCSEKATAKYVCSQISRLMRIK